MKKRANGKGTVVFLGKGRYKPYASRIVVGKDINGKPVYYDIDTFEEELDALVYLEIYHKNPTPLKIKNKKYQRITTFTCLPGTSKPYPLVPVENITASIHRQDKTNYTFKQVFDEMKKNLFPTKEEIKLERTKHIKPENKYAYNNSRNMISAYNNSKELYDKIYSELRTSDFKSYLQNSGKTQNAKKKMIQLYKNMDKYALQEDIIDKSYAQHISAPKVNSTPRTPFSYEQIEYLWNIKTTDEKENFVKDILVLSNYTGCRAEELLFIYTKNVFLDENYFVTGLKTDNGINREIPIHPVIKFIFEKYYNPKNEFLFTKENGERIFYKDYNNYYNNNFIKKHEFLKGKTAHCGRHGLETELQKLNVKKVIINSILGHSNGNVADDVYNHVSIEEKLEAIKLVTYKKGKIYVLNNNKKPIQTYYDLYG